jgi:uncharacterized membrane protein (DUF4010 family)
MTGLQNPFEIKPALWFAILFIVLTIVTNYVNQYTGNNGIITLAILVGKPDIDPFILSVVNSSNEITKLIIQNIILAMMSNTIVKSIYFTYLSPITRKQTLIRFTT